MKVDIAICTWNRANLLDTTLKSLTGLKIPDQCRVRLVLVDNRSTDNTSVIIQANSSRLNEAGLQLLALEESEQGHTYARNKAIDHLDSDLTLWTDDDVIPHVDWVAANVLAANQSQYDFWGGHIRPRFRPSQPDWISENWESLKGCFAARDLGAEPVEFAEGTLPYGANFAIRTSVQKQHRFDTELGRRGTAVLGEDELDLFRRLLSLGHRGAWVPDSVVEHLIPEERSSELYVRDYFIGQGRAVFQRGEAWSQSAGQLYRMMVWQHMMYRFKRHFAKSPAWCSHLIRSGLAAGQWKEAKATS